MDAPPLGRLKVALVALAALTSWSSAANAQDLSWSDDNRRVGWTEAAVIGGSAAAIAGLQFGVGEPEEANWIGPILLDDSFRSLLLAEGSGVELTAALSDVLLFTLSGWTIAIDSVGHAGLANDEWDTAFQTSTIAMQSHAVNALVTMGMKYAVARRRPGFGACYEQPDGDGCDERPNVSFPSGHTSSAFTGAGLVCVTHEHFNYYGGAGGTIACATAIGLAATTGLLRVRSNNHYLTDIVAGALIGFAIGYGIPKALYFGDETPSESTAMPLSAPAPPVVNFGGRF